MLYEHYLDLITQVDELIGRIDEHPDDQTRVYLTELLQRLDLLHREGLVRLVTILRNDGAGEQLARAAEDPVVKILLGLYGLADLGLPAEEPADGAGRVAFFPAEGLAVRRRPRAE
jgi:hypothetical protein